MHVCCAGVQKKAAFRNTAVPPVTPRSSENSTETAVTLPAPRPCPMLPIHTNQPWFHGHISRERAVSLLAEHGLVDGSVPGVFMSGTDLILLLILLLFFSSGRPLQ